MIYVGSCQPGIAARSAQIAARGSQNMYGYLWHIYIYIYII